MAELIVRGVEPEVVSKLSERAKRHHRSLEEEHLAILRDTLLPTDAGRPAMTFEQYLRAMPDVGEDADFGRITGTIREVDLAD